MTDITEDQILDILSDLRSLKKELKDKRAEQVELESDIEGLEDDIDGAQNLLTTSIKEYTEAGKLLPY